MNILIYLVVASGMLNLIRMTAYSVGSDIYTIKKHRQHLAKSRVTINQYLPTISVVVPAYNESAVIIRNLKSLYAGDYPHKKLDIFVVNDGSKDNTQKLVRDFIRSNGDKYKFRLINQKNQGKAAAVNRGIKESKGSLVMCLDADSTVNPDALRRAANHFRDPSVVGVASNVNIIPDGSWLALIQKLEYLVCYQMKKSEDIYGIEYIIGGIGSVYRRSILNKVGGYDGNTMTEDIDLSMKVLGAKKPSQRLAYAYDCITSTEAVHSIKSLVNQRYRWKYGRMQTYLKHRGQFFSNNVNHSKRLGWFMLPFTLVQDAIFLLEPLITGVIIIGSIVNRDPRALVAALIVITTYLLFNIWSTTTLNWRERLSLTFYAPAAYFMMFVLSYAEYVALIKALLRTHKLKQSIYANNTSWVSPERVQA